MSGRSRLRAVPDVPKFGVAVRVSRVMGRSGEQFHSPKTQEQGARAEITRAGGVVDETVGDRGVFYDLDVSGAVAPSDRPGLGAALELVRSGALDGVAVYDLSRWSRETVSGLRELEEIAAAGGQIISAGERIDLKTPSGRFSTTVQLAAHQMRRDEASRAWKATHQSRHDRGLPHGKIPMGYVRDGQGGVVVDPVLGDVVTWAFSAYADGLVSQVAIAERLSALRGRQTRQGVVSQLLRNPFVTGKVIYQDDVRPGRHEALVTEDVFEAVQRRLAADRYAAPRDRVPVSFLSGLAFCGACQQPLHRRGRGAIRASGEVVAMLRCSGMAAGCVGVGAPRVADLERVVHDEVLARARQDRDGTAGYAARRARVARARSTLAQLRAERDSLTESIGRSGALLARGVFDETAYEATAGELRRELGAVEARLREAEGVEATAGVPVEVLASAAKRIEQLWPVMTPQERRADVRLFVPAVSLDPPAYRGQPVAERVRYPEPEE